MREVTVKLFKIGELTGNAKKKALDWGRTWHNETFDTDNMTEQLQEHVEHHHGVKTETCYWSLSSCQGDGVAFYGKLDLDKLVEKQPAVKEIIDKLKAIDNTVSVNIDGKNGRYHHWNSMTPQVEVDHGHRYSEAYGLATDEKQNELDDEADKLANELETVVKELLATASRSAEKFGYECMHAEQEDEAIEELLEANEIEFDETGKRFRA